MQGVGFRPFVYALAARVGVAGYVANDRRGVIVEIEGSGSAISRLYLALDLRSAAVWR